MFSKKGQIFEKRIIRVGSGGSARLTLTYHKHLDSEKFVNFWRGNAASLVREDQTHTTMEKKKLLSGCPPPARNM